MENDKIAGLVVIALMAIAGTTYVVLDTGEELTCRTNKPIGWNILEDYGDYVEAECPYITKDSIRSYCKAEFRSTGSYERYGCAEVILVEQEVPSVSEGRKEVCNRFGCMGGVGEL